MLQAMKVDKRSPIPLYYQLAEQLREQIEAGLLSAGAQLPPERELSELVGISRMTARQALAYLERSGVLEVKPGVGTFVAAPKHTYDALHLLSFTAEIMRQGSKTSSQVLEQVVTTPPIRVARGLQLEADQAVVKLVRLRFAESTPLLQETIYIPTALCPDLVDADLHTQSLYALLEERYALQLEQTRQMLEATVANEYEADLFGITVGSPMLLLEGITYTKNEQPVEYFKAIYRGDRVRFELESRRNGFPPPQEEAGHQPALVPVIDALSSFI
ncbi:MAG: GntR family transcriptional regulator [Caldilineaceae bacterium]|nr:GntR family transcriptional regulator [Caldilineaceae bacterium]